MPARKAQSKAGRPAAAATKASTSRAAKPPASKAAGSKSTRPKVEHDDSEGVSRLIEAMPDPLRPIVERIRADILKAHATITEGVKWNSPSFYCSGWFATINIRGKHGVMVVLHRGAKPEGNSAHPPRVADPTGLLHWHSDDRASTAFADADAYRAARTPFVAIIRAWIAGQN